MPRCVATACRHAGNRRVTHLDERERLKTESGEWACCLWVGFCNVEVARLAGAKGCCERQSAAGAIGVDTWGTESATALTQGRQSTADDGDINGTARLNVLVLVDHDHAHQVLS